MYVVTINPVGAASRRDNFRFVQSSINHPEKKVDLSKILLPLLPQTFKIHMLEIYNFYSSSTKTMDVCKLPSVASR